MAGSYAYETPAFVLVLDSESMAYFVLYTLMLLLPSLPPLLGQQNLDLDLNLLLLSEEKGSGTGSLSRSGTEYAFGL